MPKTMTTPSTTKQGFRWKEVSPLTSSVIAIVTVLPSAFAYVQGPINWLDKRIDRLEDTVDNGFSEVRILLTETNKRIHETGKRIDGLYEILVK